MLGRTLFITVTVLSVSNSVIAQIEPEMVHINAGCSEIGSILIDQQSNPLRETCVQDLMIGKYEVTFLEFDLFTKETGSALRHDLNFGRDDRPVIDVTLHDAIAYAEWLSAKTGKVYRLPTDAEWEYAAKLNAEFGTGYSWGASVGNGNANCRGCGSIWDGRMTAPVGSFEANSFGIYDMHGNVWEWSSDCYYSDSPISEDDVHCEVGVVRGGSWDTDSGELVFWRRTPQISTRPARDIGFRLVLEL
jgi:formylglycine-generating enzyme required for sulfatase activity